MLKLTKRYETFNQVPLIDFNFLIILKLKYFQKSEPLF